MKIAYLCHFSNSTVRDNLLLKTWSTRNLIFRLLNHPKQCHADYAVWNTDFITEFEKKMQYEFHIISPHSGMKKRIQEFAHNGIFYHFFKDDGSLLYDFVFAKLKLGQRTNYRTNRERISKIIDKINPDILVLCGAECTPFAIAVLDIKRIPVYALLQTCANLKKYIDAGIGSEYDRSIERAIFKKVMYFGTIEKQFYDKYKEINENAICLPVRFPTHNPSIINVKKENTFAFFGRVVANKGIEDLLSALAIVVKKYDNVRLNIIGSCSSEYRSVLDKMIAELGLYDNVVYSPYYCNMDDMYMQVQKAQIAVLPGITASMNSTVRESMFMKIPTIVYETNACNLANKQKQCLIIAQMNDVEDLATKMIYCLEHPDELEVIVNNAYEYANTNFSNEQIGDKLINNITAIVNYNNNYTPIPSNLLYNEENV